MSLFIHCDQYFYHQLWGPALRGMGSWMWMILWFGHYAKMDVGHYSLLRKCTKMKKDSQMIGWREFGGTNPFYPWIILGVYKPCKWSPANQFREIANSDPLKYVQQQICRCYTSNLFKPLWDGSLASLQHGNSSSDWPPTTARKKKKKHITTAAPRLFTAEPPFFVG